MSGGFKSKRFTVSPRANLQKSEDTHSSLVPVQKLLLPQTKDINLQEFTLIFFTWKTLTLINEIKWIIKDEREYLILRNKTIVWRELRQFKVVCVTQFGIICFKLLY